MKSSGAQPLIKWTILAVASLLRSSSPNTYPKGLKYFPWALLHGKNRALELTLILLLKFIDFNCSGHQKGDHWALGYQIFCALQPDLCKWPHNTTYKRTIARATCRNVHLVLCFNGLRLVGRNPQKGTTLEWKSVPLMQKPNAGLTTNQHSGKAMPLLA